MGLKFMFLVSLSLLIGCSLKKDYPEIAHAITLRTADELNQEKGMELVGTGGGMMNQVNVLSMDLNHYELLEESKARRLAIFILDKFLNNINKDEEVRPYLNNYPFRVEDLQLILAFYSPDGRAANPGNIDDIMISDGVFTYNTRSKETDHLVTLFKETIAEARKKAELL